MTIPAVLSAERQWHVETCDVLAGLRSMPDGCVQCVVTSPPYYGLRDYGAAGQIGLEKTPAEYVTKMVEVFGEVRRVLRDDGTFWLNLGDSYAANKAERTRSQSGDCQRPSAIATNLPAMPMPIGLKPKDLIGIPWLTAFALRDAGWYLRSDIIWAKKNCMPESVTDRPTKAHEYLFLLAKSERYFYDAVAVQEPSTSDHGSGNGFKRDARLSYRDENGARGNDEPWQVTEGRNRRSVWTIATQPFPGAHFATFPSALVEPCIMAGTSEAGCCADCGAPLERVVERSKYEPEISERDRFVDPSRHDKKRKLSGKKYNEQASTKTLGWQATCDCNAATVPCVVLDPFSGAGTTAMVARKLGRRAIGIELNPVYADMGRARVANRNGVRGVKPLEGQRELFA